MPDFEDSSDDDSLQQPPSKSALKRRMLALQQLGESLVGLNEKQLARVPIADERLSRAIRETRQIRSNSARRRHMQFIGKLMRNTDAEKIQQQYDDYLKSKNSQAEAFHQLEKWRDRILKEGDNAINDIMRQYENFERSRLRQLVRNAASEAGKNQSPKSARQLFQYLKEVIYS